MFEPHPNLSKEINDAIANSELFGGADLKKLAVGRKLLVQTRNTLYTVERKEDGLYISGNQKYCPVPVKCSIPGSNFGGSMLKMDYIGVGMYMEFYVEGNNRVIVTSEVQQVTEA